MIAMRKHLLEAADMILYVIGLIVESSRTGIQHQRDEMDRARRQRRAHPEGTRGDRP